MASGSGRLLSHVGKRNERCYKIFSERETILTNVVQTIKVSKKKFAFVPRKSIDMKIIDKEIKAIDELAKIDRTSSASKASYIFMVQPREDRKTSRKSMNPPVGSYDINYQAIEKKVSAPIIKQPFTSMKKRTNNRRSCPKLVACLVPYGKVNKQGVDFSKQPKRTSLHTKSESMNYAINYSSIHASVATPILKKQTSRHELFFCGMPSPNYNSDKEKVMRKLVVDIDMSKVCGRGGKSQLSSQFTSEIQNLSLLLVGNKRTNSTAYRLSRGGSDMKMTSSTAYQRNMNTTQ